MAFLYPFQVSVSGEPAVRYMTIMLMSAKHERPRKIRFPAVVGKAAIVLLVVVVAALAWLIVQRASLLAARTDLRARNARLLRENERLLALEEEVANFLARHQGRKDEYGRQMVVRNGYKEEREILTGAGPLRIRQPRVDDRKLERTGVERFTSKILPPFMRRVPSLENLIPALYLHGISMDDFSFVVDQDHGGQG